LKPSFFITLVEPTDPVTNTNIVALTENGSGKEQSTRIAKNFQTLKRQAERKAMVLDSSRNPQPSDSTIKLIQL
jgi:hypothetical protein